MPIKLYEAEAGFDVKKVLQKARGASGPASTIAIVRRELGNRDLLYLSLFLSFKTFQDGTKAGATRSRELEWLCRLACTHNVSKALAATSPTGEGMAVASTIPIPKRAWRAIGITRELKGAGALDEAFLSSFYGISEAARKNYSVLELAKEKMAVAAAR
jgi:hypothetical protein